MAKVEELRALLAKASAWRDLDKNYDRSICVKCNCVNITESDDELTPFCYACAQEMIDALPALLDAVEAARAFYGVAPVMPTARLEARMKNLADALAKTESL